jgi:5-methylcytosine-specific restriction endonuclease McrA
MCGMWKARKKDSFDQEPQEEFDLTIQDRWNEKLREYWEQQVQERVQERVQQNDVRQQEYSEYLRTEQWQSKRRLVFQRAKNLCEGCRCAQATEVHHVSYEHFKDELLFELVALCFDCHRKVHNK